MPAVAAWIIGGLISALGTFVGRVLVSLGMGLVVYKGMDLMAQQFKFAIFSQLNMAAGADPIISSLMGLLQVGTCANILLSALVVRMAIRGLSGGAIKRWVVR